MQDWHKQDQSPVTSVDIAVDRFLFGQLRGLFPQAGWLSEETADNDERLQYQYVWVVDPIDGTRSMLAGRPEFCVSVGLVETGVGPLLGVIANPSTGERFFAQVGQGAHDQLGGRLQSRSTFSAESPQVLVSHSDISNGLWQGVLPIAQMTPLGSLAYKMALVAAGRFDGHATAMPRSEWDAAAGSLILSEAGGMATDLHGRPLQFNLRKTQYDGMVVASTPAYAAMLEYAHRSAKLAL